MNLMEEIKADRDALPQWISLGAGVQSSTMALMAARGEIHPMPAGAIFADTGSEPAEVYHWLDWLETQLPFPVHRVRNHLTNMSLHEWELSGKVRGTKKTGEHAVHIPYFTINQGERAILPRQCTNQWKIGPIARFVRHDIIGLKPRQSPPKEPRAVLWIGISTDERRRAKPSRFDYIEHRVPLLEANMGRGHCLEWMQSNGYQPPPRSACFMCPFKNSKEWAAATPDEFQRAVDFDVALRAKKIGGDKDVFIHDSLRPLSDVDHAMQAGNLNFSLFDDECEGMCGL